MPRSGEASPVQLDLVVVDVGELPILKAQFADDALRCGVLRIDHGQELSAKRLGRNGDNGEPCLGRISLAACAWHKPVPVLQASRAFELKPRRAAVADDLA